MFTKLSKKELDALWADSQHMASVVQDAANQRDPIAFYNAVDWLQTNTVRLRNHFAALAKDDATRTPE